MIRNIFNWPSNYNLPISLNFTVEPYGLKGFDWTPFASAALGGILSIAASMIAFHLSNKSEKLRKIEEEKKTEAMRALTGYFKILNTINSLANIRMHIDKCFADAYENGISDPEPFQCVGPSAGRFLEPDRLKAEEYVFLLKIGDVETINMVGLIEQRSINTQSILETYSNLRIEFESWIEELPARSRQIDGLMRVDEIPNECIIPYNAKAAKLNQLFFGVIEHLDDDIKEGEKILRKFSESANRLYKPHFPSVDMEIRK